MEQLTLAEYIEQSPLGKRSTVERDLAHQLNVGLSTIRHWRTGRRRMTPHHAIELQKITNGVVHKSKSRPDIFED